MSRSMTAAQVIALGEYLEPDFDPATLTVSQLLGVFGFHNVKYPTPYTKPKLVQLFHAEVRPKAAKFKKERLKKEQSIASEEGIKDGVTGRLLTEDKPLRRSSRRSSRAPSQEPPVVAPAEPSKRRRSSAQPTVGGPSTRSTQPAEPVLMEESEPEEVVVRKVSRGKKTTEGAGSRARRASQFAEDSGWEDNNIFQSGAESSSPARPSPVKPRSRRSAAPKARKSTRKAESVPPHVSSSPRNSDDEFDDGEAHLPPRSRFAPQLPPDVPKPEPVKKPTSSRQKLSFKPVEHPPSPLRNDNVKEEEPEEELIEESEAEDLETLEEDVQEEEETEEAKQVHDVSRRIAEGGAPARRGPPPTRVSLGRFLVCIAILLYWTQIIPYKRQSEAIGFCDAGRDTNDVLEAFRTKYHAVEACNRENRTLLYLPSTLSSSSKPAEGEQAAEHDQTPCPTLPVIPLRPDSCTPCPDHAMCARDSVICATGYILRPHPALSWLPFPTTNSLASKQATLPALTELVLKAVSLFDGLPGVGPVALPPRCVEDPRRKRHIGVLGKAIEAVLGQERGKRVCAGDVPPVADAEGGEARRWGMEMDALRDAMKQKTAPQLLDTFDDTFNEAIQQLVHWGGVLTASDTRGQRYIAHKTPNLDWNCYITVKARETWQAWRATVLAAVVLMISTIVLRARRAQRATDAKRVAELVQIALDTLRNQELAHHTDPVAAPAPYLSSLQLRDLVLQDEHSVRRRRRLWDEVERIVEGNANVRANLEEVHGGDELRVWRWVGGGGRRRVQFEERGDEGRVVA